MSLDSIAASYFGCAEAPVWIPDGFVIDRVPTCKSCNLRLVSPVAGNGNITPREDGLLVDENPLTTLSINGIQYNLVESILLIAGAHRLPGRAEPCKAELACFFQNTRDFSQHVCLCLPIDIGNGSAKAYFNTLGTLGSGRPTLGTIIPASANFLLYRGADLRGRNARSNVPASFCDPVRRVVTYYVCQTPIFMEQSDYTRFVTRAGAGLVGPPKPITPVVNSRLIELTSLVKGIKIGEAKPLNANTTEGPGYPTKAMKCYRVDPARDIIKDKVYVGGKGVRTTLEKELAESVDETTSSGIMPGDLQNTIAIIVGLLLAVVICAAIFVFIFSHVFTNYEEAQHLYDANPISASTLTSSIFPKGGFSLFPKGLFTTPSVCPPPPQT